MAPDCCSCAGAPRRRRSIAATLVPGVLLALLPKCPLCVAAYLSLLGVSTGIAVSLARMLPVALAVATVLGLVCVVVRLVGRLGKVPVRRPPAAR